MKRPGRSWAAESRAAAALLVLSLLAGGCTFSARTGSRDLLPTRDVPPAVIRSDPTGDAAPSTAPTTPRVARRGILEVRVVDTLGRTRSDVPVDYRGPADGRLITGADGSAARSVPAGSYVLTIPKACAGELEIFQERIHDPVLVFAGRRSVARFHELDARRRYWPSTPVEWSMDPPWTPGTVITLSFLLLDRCEGDAGPPGAPFDALEYRPNAVVRLVGTPGQRAGAGGRATVRFSCRRAGDGALALVDLETGERVELLRLRPSFAPLDELCG